MKCAVFFVALTSFNHSKMNIIIFHNIYHAAKTLIYFLLSYFSVYKGYKGF